MTVQEIVKKYLEENGYDGLCDDECGCFIDDLNPCGSCMFDCQAGYKKKRNGSWIIHPVKDEDNEDLEMGTIFIGNDYDGECDDNEDLAGNGQ